MMRLINDNHSTKSSLLAINAAELAQACWRYKGVTTHG